MKQNRLCSQSPRGKIQETGASVKRERKKEARGCPQETSTRDFPGGPVVKIPPCNAGDLGSIPGQGTKIPQAVGQLSPWATTTELVGLN